MIFCNRCMQFETHILFVQIVKNGCTKWGQNNFPCFYISRTAAHYISPLILKRSQKRTFVASLGSRFSLGSRGDLGPLITDVQKLLKHHEWRLVRRVVSRHQWGCLTITDSPVQLWKCVEHDLWTFLNNRRNHFVKIFPNTTSLFIVQHMTA